MYSEKLFRRTKKKTHFGERSTLLRRCLISKKNVENVSFCLNSREIRDNRDLKHRRRRRRRRQIIPRKNWDGTVRSRYEDRNLSFARRERERKQKNASQ